MVSRLSGRERILAEMFHQCGNRAVTNNSCTSELVPMPVLRDNPKHERTKPMCAAHFSSCIGPPVPLAGTVLTGGPTIVERDMASVATHDNDSP